MKLLSNKLLPKRKKKAYVGQKICAVGG